MGEWENLVEKCESISNGLQCSESIELKGKSPEHAE